MQSETIIHSIARSFDVIIITFWIHAGVHRVHNHPFVVILDILIQPVVEDCNPILAMIPGAWPPLSPPSDKQKDTTSSGESTDPYHVPTPTTEIASTVESTPVLPSVGDTTPDWMRIEDIKKYDKRMVMTLCTPAWIQKMMITSNDRTIECIIVWDWNLQYFTSWNVPNMLQYLRMYFLTVLSKN